MQYVKYAKRLSSELCPCWIFSYFSVLFWIPKCCESLSGCHDWTPHHILLWQIRNFTDILDHTIATIWFLRWIYRKYAAFDTNMNVTPSEQVASPEHHQRSPSPEFWHQAWLLDMIIFASSLDLDCLDCLYPSPGVSKLAPGGPLSSRI